MLQMFKTGDNKENIKPPSDYMNQLRNIKKEGYLPLINKESKD